MKRENLGRRDFLKKSSAAALAFTIIPRHVLGGTGYLPPSDQLTKGIIVITDRDRPTFCFDGDRKYSIKPHKEIKVV